MDHNIHKESTGDRMFTVINYFALTFVLIAVLYPLIYIVSASLSNPDDVISGKVWLWPVNPTWMGYEGVLKYKQIWTGFYNSLFYTVAGTLINVLLTILAAYPLSRKDLFGKNVIMYLFVFTMLFSGGLVPTYLLVKSLGMLNTIWAMLLPGALGVWNVIITRTYFQQTLPDELLEAAQMDGCRDVVYLWRIVLPLSGPIVAVITLFYAVGHWNSYFSALIYLKSDQLYPLQIFLRNILIQNEIDASMIVDAQAAARIEGQRELLKYSLIIISSGPVMLLYPFVQKYFVKGVMLGSIKS